MRFLPFPVPGARSIAPSLIANGDFETNTTGWNSTNGTVARNTSESKFGAACGQWTVGSNPAVDEAYSEGGLSGATAGRRYTGEVWAKGSGGSVGKTIRVVLREKEGASGAAVVAISQFTLTGGWRRLAIAGTVAQNDRQKVSIGLVIGTSGTPVTTGDAVLLDGVRVVRV